MNQLAELLASFGNVVAVVLVQPQEGRKYARKAAPKTAQLMSVAPIRRRRRRRKAIAKQQAGM